MGSVGSFERVVNIVRQLICLSPPYSEVAKRACSAAHLRLGKTLLICALIVVSAARMATALASDSDWTNDPPRLDGYGGQFTLVEPIRELDSAPLRTADGKSIDLSDFRGRVVLLNFWATWCAPCVHEMPSLDRLAGDMAGSRLVVIPAAIDRAGSAAVTRFYRDRALRNLGIYLDPDQRLGYMSADNSNNAPFAVLGLPISYVIDHRGRVMGFIAGAVDWQSDAAKALIQYYLRQVED